MIAQHADICFLPAKDQWESSSVGELLCRAPGKLNLSLRVLGRDEDGFHEIDSIAAKVTLYDELLFRARGDGRVRLECSGCDCGRTQDNLVTRAAELLRPMAGGLGADIRLTKQIPPGAGLGGGSSDAAATLQALNRLWKLGLPVEELARLGGQIGSDVPLFLDGPAVRIRGRGERVDSIKLHPFFGLLYLPDLSCNTARVYAAYDEILGSERPLPAAFPAQLEQPPSRWRSLLTNDLQPAAARVRPALVGISAAIAAATHLPVHLTGSGSALFVLTDDEPAAREAARSMPADMSPRCRLVCSNPW